MTKARITDYSIEEFLLMTVKVSYNEDVVTYSVSVPAPGAGIWEQTLDQDQKKALYESLSA